MSILQALNDLQQKQLKENQNKLQPCTHCHSDEWELKKFFNSDGNECYPYFCASCGMRLRICEKKSIAMKLGFSEI